METARCIITEQEPPTETLAGNPDPGNESDNAAEQLTKEAVGSSDDELCTSTDDELDSLAETLLAATESYDAAVAELRRQTPGQISGFEHPLCYLDGKLIDPNQVRAGAGAGAVWFQCDPPSPAGLMFDRRGGLSGVPLIEAVGDGSEASVELPLTVTAHNKHGTTTFKAVLVVSRFGPAAGWDRDKSHPRWAFDAVGSNWAELLPTGKAAPTGLSALLEPAATPWVVGQPLPMVGATYFDIEVAGAASIACSVGVKQVKPGERLAHSVRFAGPGPRGDAGWCLLRVGGGGGNNDGDGGSPTVYTNGVRCAWSSTGTAELTELGEMVARSGVFTVRVAMDTGTTRIALDRPADDAPRTQVWFSIGVAGTWTKWMLALQCPAGTRLAPVATATSTPASVGSEVEGPRAVLVGGGVLTTPFAAVDATVTSEPQKKRARSKQKLAVPLVPRWLYQTTELDDLAAAFEVLLNSDCTDGTFLVWGSSSTSSDVTLNARLWGWQASATGTHHRGDHSPASLRTTIKMNSNDRSVTVVDQRQKVLQEMDGLEKKLRKSLQDLKETMSKSSTSESIPKTDDDVTCPPYLVSGDSDEVTAEAETRTANVVAVLCVVYLGRPIARPITVNATGTVLSVQGATIDPAPTSITELITVLRSPGVPGWPVPLGGHPTRAELTEKPREVDATTGVSERGNKAAGNSVSANFAVEVHRAVHHSLKGRAQLAGARSSRTVLKSLSFPASHTSTSKKITLALKPKAFVLATDSNFQLEKVARVAEELQFAPGHPGSFWGFKVQASQENLPICCVGVEVTKVGTDETRHLIYRFDGQVWSSGSSNPLQLPWNSSKMAAKNDGESHGFEVVIVLSVTPEPKLTWYANGHSVLQSEVAVAAAIGWLPSDIAAITAVVGMSRCNFANALPANAPFASFVLLSNTRVPEPLATTTAEAEAFIRHSESFEGVDGAPTASPIRGTLSLVSAADGRTGGADRAGTDINCDADRAVKLWVCAGSCGWLELALDSRTVIVPGPAPVWSGGQLWHEVVVMRGPEQWRVLLETVQELHRLLKMVQSQNYPGSSPAVTGLSCRSDLLSLFGAGPIGRPGQYGFGDWPRPAVVGSALWGANAPAIDLQTTITPAVDGESAAVLTANVLSDDLFERVTVAFSGSGETAGKALLNNAASRSGRSINPGVADWFIELCCRLLVGVLRLDAGAAELDEATAITAVERIDPFKITSDRSKMTDRSSLQSTFGRQAFPDCALRALGYMIRQVGIVAAGSTISAEAAKVLSTTMAVLALRVIAGSAFSQDTAAVIIQSVYRGYRVRCELKSAGASAGQESAVKQSSTPAAEVSGISSSSSTASTFHCVGAANTGFTFSFGTKAGKSKLESFKSLGNTIRKLSWQDACLEARQRQSRVVPLSMAPTTRLADFLTIDFGLRVLCTAVAQAEEGDAAPLGALRRLCLLELDIQLIDLVEDVVATQTDRSGRPEFEVITWFPAPGKPPHRVICLLSGRRSGGCTTVGVPERRLEGAIRAMTEKRYGPGRHHERPALADSSSPLPVVEAPVVLAKAEATFTISETPGTPLPVTGTETWPCTTGVAEVLDLKMGSGAVITLRLDEGAALRSRGALGSVGCEKPRAVSKQSLLLGVGGTTEMHENGVLDGIKLWGNRYGLFSTLDKLKGLQLGNEINNPTAVQWELAGLGATPGRTFRCALKFNDRPTATSFLQAATRSC